jgi:hypothetical protein
MAQNTSYTKALRAIGQDLEAMGVTTFRLKRSDDFYLVRGARPHSGIKRFLKLRRGDLQETTYSLDEIERLDELGQAKRGSGKVLDLLTLSQVLRAVGTLIDLREGRLVELNRLAEPGAVPSLAFQYENHEGENVQEKYSYDDLRDFCEHMRKWRKSV